MADRISQAKRSELMARIKGTNTEPERVLSRELDLVGVKHVRHVKRLPGTPDIVVSSKRLAVFVHGCFWHGCPEHYRPPQTRREFWLAKVMRTRRRDETAARALRLAGWKVVTVWEHENLKEAAAGLAKLLRRLPSLGSASPESRQRPLPDSSSIATCRSGVLKASLPNSG